jgi:hypothetical protein
MSYFRVFFKYAFKLVLIKKSSMRILCIGWIKGNRLMLDSLLLSI